MVLLSSCFSSFFWYPTERFQECIVRKELDSRHISVGVGHNAAAEGVFFIIPFQKRNTFSGSFLNVPCFIVCFLNSSMLHVTRWKTIRVAKFLVSPSIRERRGTSVPLYPSINKIEERQGANIHYRTGRNEIVKCLPVKTIRRDLTLCTLYKGFSEIRYSQSLCKITITLKGSKVKRINYTWNTRFVIGLCTL